MSKFYSAIAFIAGGAVGTFSGFDNPHIALSISAAFFGGWLFYNTLHNATLALVTRLLASSHGKKAMLDLIADGIAKLEANHDR